MCGLRVSLKPPSGTSTSAWPTALARLSGGRATGALAEALVRQRSAHGHMSREVATPALAEPAPGRQAVRNESAESPQDVQSWSNALMGAQRQMRTSEA